MKKSTGIIFLVAAALAAFVYYYEFKRAPASETPADNSKPAFAITEPDIAGITLERPAAAAVTTTGSAAATPAAPTTIVFDHRSDGWYIAQPTVMRADQALVDGITTELAFVRVDRTFPAAANTLESYGLDKPAVTLEFTLTSGAKHKLQLGAKDFAGSSVYALVDDAKDVSLLANTILTASDKSLEDFRDHSVQAIATGDATSFDLINESGDVSATKNGDNWKIDKPRTVGADASAVASLLQAVGGARITHFVSDKASASDLAKYGLVKPEITFQAKLADGKSSELQIGKKEGEEYYARDTSRPMVFRVKDDLHMALSEKFFDLRDKLVINFVHGDVTRLEVRNQNGTTACVADPGGDLVIDQGPGKKIADAPPCPDFVPQLESAQVQEIYDTPAPDIVAKLASPAVLMTVTDKSGSKTEVRVSAVSGDSVYAQTSAGLQIYKLDKQVFDDLNVKPSDAKSP